MDRYLKHHGVLGQKWGVIRSNRAAKKLNKADNKYLKNGKEFTRAFFKAHNHGAEEINLYIKEKGGIDPNNKKQMMEYTKRYQDSLNTAASILGLGVSPSGRYSLDFVVSSEGQPSWNIIDNK